MRLLLCLAVAVAFAAGCRGPRWDTPEGAYASFSQALQRRDYRTAYEALSEKTRSLIAERAKELSSASGGAVREEPALLAFAQEVKPAPLTQAKLVREEAGSATVEATAGDRTQEIRMVKEGDRWKVDLSAVFKK